MKRGEIVTVAGGGDFGRKPRPAVIVQADAFVDTLSVVVCPLSSFDVDAPDFWPLVQPSVGNGLLAPSWIVDKITSLWRFKADKKVGQLSPSDLLRLDRALLLFLGPTRS